MSFRVENGRVVPEAGSPAGPGAAAAPRPGGESGGSSGASSRAATPGSPGAGMRHPPPSLLAEVMDLHTAAQTRLAGLGTRLAAVLREAGHAMSDIMLQFSRPPPRQLRARPFVIQSVLQSAVIQSVPVQLGGGPAPAAAASTPPA